MKTTLIPRLSKNGFRHNPQDERRLYTRLYNYSTPTSSSEDPAHTHIGPAAHWALLTDGGRARLTQAPVAAREDEVRARLHPAHDAEMIT